jgi:hypothetical protein
VRAAPVLLYADPATCHLQFDALGRKQLLSACDIMRTTLTDAGIPYSQQPLAEVGTARAEVGSRVVAGWPVQLPAMLESQQRTRVASELKEALALADYPAVADRAQIRPWAILGILLLLMLASTALYGPQAATLVELFPSRIRYTGLSVPYNIGVGWIGGLLPVSAFALVAARGNIYAGLLYPLVFTVISIVCTILFLPETRGIPLERAGASDSLPSRRAS